MASLLSWSDLPLELLTMIKNRLNKSPSDVCRFRSVCSSWRSSTPPVKNSFQFPNVLWDNISDKNTNLKQKSIYCLEPLFHSSFTTPWYVAIKLVDGKNEYINSLTTLWIDPIHYQFPTQLNLCDFKITELQKVYSVVIDDSTRKALFISSSYYDETLLAVCATNMTFYKLENSQWVVLKEGTVMEDIVLYHGRVWSLDGTGRTFVYNSYLEATEVPSCVSFEDEYTEFYFIESLGYLFVAEFKQLPENRTGSFNLYGKDELDPIKIQKFVVGENKFVEVRHLDDRVFVIAQEFPWSFSLPSFHVPGGMGNCIISSAICYEDYDSDDDVYFHKFTRSIPTTSHVWEIEKDRHDSMSSYSRLGELFLPSRNWFLTGNPS